jgi:hypothetical protein
LKTTGAFVFLVPLLWLLTPFFAKISLTAVVVYLLVEEFFSNFIWAGFNLCATNFIYDAVTKQRLALCIAYFNILNGFGVFIGATAGGLLASVDLSFLGINPLLFVFLISGIIRFLVYVFMMPKIKEVREVQPYQKGEFRRELRKILLPIHSKFNILPQGRPVGSTSLSHSNSSS